MATIDPLQQARDEVTRLYDEQEIPFGRHKLHVGIAEWRRRNGHCRYNTALEAHRFGKRVTGAIECDGEHTVLINAKILEDSGRDAFNDTVRHEVAHVASWEADEYSGHGKPWQKWARKLGASPKSCHNKKNREYDYFLACPRGCFRNGYHRRSKRIQKPHTRACSYCGATCVSYEAVDTRPTVPGACAVSLD